MTNFQNFKFGNFSFNFSPIGDTVLPTIPDRMIPYQIHPAQPVDFQFFLHNEIPDELIKCECVKFRSSNWVLYEYQQMPLFEKLFPTFPACRVFIHIDTDASIGNIYFEKAEIPPWFYPFYDFVFIDLLANLAAGYIHASGVIWKNKVFIFTGFSGVGKSTLAKMLSTTPDILLLSDERILFVQENHQIMAYGTPWYSTIKSTSPVGAPLNGIYFIHHGQQNSITPIRPVMASALIYQQFYPANWNKIKLDANLQLIETIAKTIPAYHLDFLPDPSATVFLKNLWNE